MRRRRNGQNHIVVDIILSIFDTLFIISIAVIFTINFRPLYYADINILDIPKSSGFSKETILSNYNALIDYCSPFYKGELKFPSLNMSESGRIHFEETKDIFSIFYVIALICGIITLFNIMDKILYRQFKFLRMISITSVVIPLVVALAILVNFDQTFVIFHKLFFNNDYWIFDPVLDPVINILPEEFFMHCALLIVFIVLLISFLISVVYRRFKKEHDSHYIR